MTSVEFHVDLPEHITSADFLHITDELAKFCVALCAHPEYHNDPDRPSSIYSGPVYSWFRAINGDIRKAIGQAEHAAGVFAVREMRETANRP